MYNDKYIKHTHCSVYQPVYSNLFVTRYVILQKTQKQKKHTHMMKKKNVATNVIKIYMGNVC